MCFTQNDLKLLAFEESFGFKQKIPLNDERIVARDSVMNQFQLFFVKCGIDSICTGITLADILNLLGFTFPCVIEPDPYRANHFRCTTENNVRCKIFLQKTNYFQIITATETATFYIDKDKMYLSQLQTDKKNATIVFTPYSEHWVFQYENALLKYQVILKRQAENTPYNLYMDLILSPCNSYNDLFDYMEKLLDSHFQNYSATLKFNTKNAFYTLACEKEQKNIIESSHGKNFFFTFPLHTKIPISIDAPSFPALSKCSFSFRAFNIAPLQLFYTILKLIFIDCADTKICYDSSPSIGTQVFNCYMENRYSFQIIISFKHITIKSENVTLKFKIIHKFSHGKRKFEQFKLILEETILYKNKELNETIVCSYDANFDNAAKTKNLISVEINNLILPVSSFDKAQLVPLQKELLESNFSQRSEIKDIFSKYNLKIQKIAKF